MENLLDYFKAYNSITNPELKFTLETMQRISGVPRMEDVAFHYENRPDVKLHECSLTNVEPLKYLLNVQELVLFGNRISDISPLVQLSRVQHLNLIKNTIVFLNGINGMVGLQKLYLGLNLITDVTPLTGMRDLKMLGLKGNKIKDLKPLETLTGLVELNLSGNPLDAGQIQALRGKLPGCKIIFE